GHELIAAPGGFVVVENPARGVQRVRFSVIACELKAGHLRDSINRTRMEASLLVLWYLLDPAEHLTGAREIEAALGRQIVKRSQDVVSSVDIGIQRGELVFEGIAHKALGGEMVALVGQDRPYDAM